MRVMMDNQILRSMPVLRHYLAFFLLASSATFLLAVSPAAGAAHRGNFTGITMSDTIAEIEQLPDDPKYKPVKEALKNGATPPDTIGAVGPQHIVEMTNGGYAVYRKNGTRLLFRPLSTFWKEAGFADAQQRPFVFDPVVQYDPSSKRFFALAGDNSLNTTSASPQTDRIHLAVSKSSDPTQGWKSYAWDSNPPHTRPGNQLWADQATLGFNKNGVFIAANMFTLGRSAFPPNFITILAISKADVLKGVASDKVHVTRFDRLDPKVTGAFVQPAVNLDNTGGPEIFLSDWSNQPAGKAGRLKVTLLTGNINKPTLETNTDPIAVQPYGKPLPAHQPGGPNTIDTGAGQSFLAPSLIVRNGALWGVENVERNQRDALRWFEIDARSMRLLHEGVIADRQLDVYYGSIAVNEFGDVVIGFSGSGNNQFASSYAAIGRVAGGRATFGSPRLLREGVSTYDYRPGGPESARNRWGDYSATVVDPQDPRSFWTFQEFVLQKDRWGTQISNIHVGRQTSVS